MASDQPIPAIWLLSDQRNDAALEQALASLPPGSGFVFRHYHLAAKDRRDRFAGLLRICHAHRHLSILSGDAACAAQWGADGIYAAPERLAAPSGMLRLATVHDAAEIAAAEAAGADALFLSPVFATRSHPGAAVLGPEQFRALAARATRPVIALGGMDESRAATLGWPRWAAIDAFATGRIAGIPKDS